MPAPVGWIGSDRRASQAHDAGPVRLVARENATFPPHAVAGRTLVSVGHSAPANPPPFVMRNQKTTLIALAFCATSISAQAFSDSFSYPDGPVPAGWTVHSGSWAIRNGKLIESPSTLGHKYVTRDGIAALDCVVEIDATWGSAGIQAAGAAARHGGTATESCVMAKVQSNSATPAGFDTMWLYERPGTLQNRVGIVPPYTDVRVRLTLIGAEATMAVDTDRDGTFETSLNPLTIATHNAAGRVGAVTGNSPGIGVSELDNFAFFDAVLVAQPGAQARIGSSYLMNLHTPATQPTPYYGIASLTPGVFPLNGSRAIPLGFDPLFDLSLTIGGALGLVGATNASGVGTPQFHIPNLAYLVGLQVFVSAFTLDLAQPFGVGNISNNLSFVIIP